MKNHRFLYRALSFLCAMLLCLGGMLSAAETAVFAADETPAVRFYVQAAMDKKSVTLSVQMRGNGLARTQFAALAFDAELLSLSGMPSVPGLSAMEGIDAFTFLPDSGWSFDAILPYVGTSADGTIGYLLLYPTRVDAVTYADFKTVCYVHFTCTDTDALQENSIRLLTDEEQERYAQSVKYAVCTEEESFLSYGARFGGDRLEDAVFTGNTAVTGSRDEAGKAADDTPWINRFRDVSDNDPYYDAIAYVCKNKLFIGSSDNTFSPLTTMNRATFATVLCRLAGAEDTALADSASAKETVATFSDIKEGEWYVPYIAWGVQSGLFLGYGDGRFGPDDAITHAQMYLLIQRFTEKYGYQTKAAASASALSALKDWSAVDTWAQDAVRFAFANGLLIINTDMTILPGAHAARWELASLLLTLSKFRCAEITEEASVSVAAGTVSDYMADGITDDSNLQNAYRKLYEGLMTLSADINLSAYGLDIVQMKRIYQQVIKQPEFFYVGNEFRFRYLSDTGEIVSVTPTYTMRGETLVTAQRTYAAKLDEILAGVSADWTDFEKALYFHDYLAVYFQYDETLTIANTYDFLVKGQGVCQAYTLTYQALLDAVGIQNDRAVSESMDHTWNLICLDDKWYHVDVTWDDPTPDQFGQAQHTYFLRSDTSMKNNRHYDWTADHVCSDTRYDNAAWHTVRTPFVPFDDGLWYYIEDETGTVWGWNTQTSRKNMVGSLRERWVTSNGTWNHLYTGLVRCGNTILYNSAGAVYALHPGTGVAENIYTHTGGGMLCGIRMGGYDEKIGAYTIQYLTRMTPTDSGGTAGKFTMKNALTYTVYGTISGYFADAPIVVRLSKNGTPVKTADLPRAKRFLPDTAEFRLDGVRPGTYDLTVEKSGCYPCIVSGLVVSGDTDITSVLQGYVLISGDFNNDGVIDEKDTAILCKNKTFNQKTAAAQTPAADLNGDGKIDFIDYVILTAPDRMGKTASGCRIAVRE